MPFTVLVVDDDPDTRINLSDILELDGYEVECVGTAAEALARNDWHRFGAILLDRRLPDALAEDVLPRLRALAPDAAVIVVTGQADIHGAVAAFRLGAADYVLKPIAPDELRARLGRLAEHRRDREALRQKEEELQAVLDALPVGVWFTDAGGRIVYGNPAGQRIWGGPQYGGVEGTGGFRASWPDTGWRTGPNENVLSRALGGETSLDEVVEIAAVDGTCKTILNSAVPLRDEAGVVRGAVVINQDVTERMRDQAALQESEERMRLFIEHAPAALAMFDREMRYLGASRRWLTDYGLGEKDIVGRSHYEVLPGISALWRSAHFRALAGEVVRLDEDRFVRSDGSAQWLRWEARPWHDAAGNIGGIVLFTEDITAIKQAEAALRESTDRLRETTQQLWQAARLAGVGELAASIAHELNNPLATVALRIESLLSRTPLDDPRRRPLQVVDQEVARMANLVSNLLGFSRPGRDQISAVDLREEATMTIELVDHHMARRRIQVETDFSPQAPSAAGDRQQLRQVLLNLFTNAADAMSDGGRLTIRVQPGDLAGRPAATLEVADTGCGIAQEHLTRIFDPFFTTKEEGKGTGLGLAICNRIVEQHQGELEVESTVGVGTTIRIRLPVPAAGHNDVARPAMVSTTS